MSPRPIDQLLSQLITLKFPDSKAVQDKEVASLMGISAAAFSNYRQSKRKPDTKSAATIARNWAVEVLKENPGELRNRLAAIEFEKVELKPAPLEKLFLSYLVRATDSSAEVTGLNLLKSPIRVSYLNYGVFSGQEHSFFERLLDRWLGRQLDLKRTMRQEFALEEELESGKTHLGSCFFASVGRARSARFFPTPLRVSLACICHPMFEPRFEEIAAALSTHRRRTKIELAPILVRGEVGHFHALHTLGFKADELEQWEGSFQPADLAQRLIRASEDADAGHGPVPVVIVDEYTGFKVLKELEDYGRFALPITTSVNARKSRLRREMPDYCMSFACARKEKEFADFLDESLHIFLNTEVETTARAMADSFWQLEAEIFDALRFVTSWGGDRYDPRKLSEGERRQVARQYCRYTFSLDSAALTARSSLLAGWYRILNRARDIVNEESVDKVRIGTLRSAIAELLHEDGAPSRQFRTPAQLERVHRLTDLNLHMDEMLGRYEDQIVRLIQLKCTGGEPTDKIDVVELDGGDPQRVATQQRHWGAITQLLNELRNLYLHLDDPIGQPPGPRRIGEEIAARIEEDWISKLARYELVLLAMGERNSPAGILCVRTEPGCQKSDKIRASPDEVQHLRTRCEFRYIWVAQAYRGRNVSRLLIGQALDWCLRQGRFTHVRASILPQLGDAIHRLQRHGFKYVEEEKRLDYDSAYNPGRLILELKLGT